MISVRSHLIHNPIHQNYMRPLILCRERLDRILQVLERNGGSQTVRELSRTYAVWEWEVEQAEKLGWLRIVIRKPKIGRPARVAEKLNKKTTAKLPPYREHIQCEISFRHIRFAFESLSIMPGGYFGFKRSTLLHAYLKIYPNARSRAGASVSANRLMKRQDVKVVRFWYHRTMHTIPKEPIAVTVEGIIQRLKELKLA